MSGYYIDISQWQALNIDWVAYKKWAEQWDGVSRVALRSSYGTGFTDTHYATFRREAEQAGIDTIIHYHYAYPQLNKPQDEALWNAQVVGTIRENDYIMLDMEENGAQLALWAEEWLKQQEQHYNKKPLLYASHSYVWNNLQKLELARYPLVLAHWDTKDIPACPLPYARFTVLQTRDDASNIPGVPGTVDLNMWL